MPLQFLELPHGNQCISVGSVSYNRGILTRLFTHVDFVAKRHDSLVVPRLNFCLRLQCLGSFPVFVFVNPWTRLSSLIRTNKSQPRSGWRHKPKKFKNSESNSPECK